MKPIMFTESEIRKIIEEISDTPYSKQELEFMEKYKLNQYDRLIATTIFWFIGNYDVTPRKEIE